MRFAFTLVADAGSSLWEIINDFRLIPISGELLYRNYGQIRPKAIDEAKEYFHRAIRDGKQMESYRQLAHIYKAERNLPKAIEMLENTLLYWSALFNLYICFCCFW